MCAVGILSFTFYCVLQWFLAVPFIQVVDFDNLLQDVFGSSTS